MAEAHKDGLTEAQRRMIVESGPDDRTGDEGVGVELRSGADYAVAKALERRGLGHVQGPGGPLPGMYWNDEEGLFRRAAILGLDAASVDDDE